MPQAVSPTQDLQKPLHVDPADVSRFFDAIRRRSLWILATAIGTSLLAGYKAHTSQPTYGGSFEILINSTSAETEVIPSSAGKPRLESLTPQDQVHILASQSVLSPLVQQLSEAQASPCDSLAESENQPISPISQCYSAISQALTLELLEEATPGLEGSRIVRVSYKGSSIEDTQTRLETLAQIYLNYGLASRQADVARGLSFLTERLPVVQENVSRLQQKLKNMRQVNNLLTPEAEGQQVSQQRSNLQREYLALSVSLSEKYTLLSDLESQSSSSEEMEISSPVLTKSSRHQELVSEVLRIEREIAAASSIYLDSSPAMQQLQLQKSQISSLLQRERANAQKSLVNEIYSLEAQRAKILQVIDSLDNAINSLSNITLEAENIEQGLDIATNNLKQLLEKKEVLELEIAQREAPWEVINSPTSHSSQPSLVLYAGIGFVTGLVLAFGMVILIDSLEEKLYTVDELKHLTTLPILGIIPNRRSMKVLRNNQSWQKMLNYSEPLQLGTSDKLLPASQENTEMQLERHAFLNESYFAGTETEVKSSLVSAMINIRRARLEGDVNSIVVTSASSNIDESRLFSANLAQAASSMGERVLLICNHISNQEFSQWNLFTLLENPDILDQTASLSSTTNRVLVASASDDFEKSVDSLFLLNQKIRDFLEAARKNFDLIIFDSPDSANYLGLSMIAPETDGVVILSNLGNLKSKQLKQTLERLWHNRSAVLGIVALQPE